MRITLRKGLTGAKPPAFCRWIIDLLNGQKDDIFDDLFPGTGAFGLAWEEWTRDLFNRSVSHQPHGDAKP